MSFGLELKPQDTALVVVDMQKGFCKPGGSLYCERSESVIPEVRSFLERCRENSLEIIFTKDLHEEEFETDHYNEFERWGKHLVRGTVETGVVEELKPIDPGVKEKIVEKGTYDAFFESNLNHFLRVKDIENVLFTGVLTDVCVLNTAISASLRDYRSIIVKDCTEALEKEDKEYGLKLFEKIAGETWKAREIKFL